MAKTETPPSIHLALSLIIQAVAAVQKTRKVQVGDSGGYMFRGVEDIMNALHPIFSDKGVTLVPTKQTPVYDRFEMPGKHGPKMVFTASVIAAYALTAADGSSVPCEGAGFGMDFGDKALPKAQSMALKNMLCHTFLIPTKDVADADSENFSFDAARAANPNNPYEGKTLAELEKLRDDAIAAGNMPGGPLLGAISVLKHLNQESDTQLGAEKKPAAPAKKETATKTEPTKPAPAKAPAKAVVKPTAPPPAEDPAPGAEPEGDPGFSDEEPAAPAQEDIYEHVFNSVKHPKYAGKKFGELSEEDLVYIRDEWAYKQKAKIDADPAKARDRDILKTILGAMKKPWDASKGG